MIEVESSPVSPEAYAAPIIPQKAVAKTYHSVPLPSAPHAHELDNIEWGARFNGPGTESKTRSGSGYQTPQTPNDVEMSRPPSPGLNEHDGVDTMQSFSNPPMNRFRMTSVSLLNFSNGLNDSAPGALIPYIEKYAIIRHTLSIYLRCSRYYDVGYAIVSLIFVTNALGFIFAAFCVDALRVRLGR